MTDKANFGRTPGYWKNHVDNWDLLTPPPDVGGQKPPYDEGTSYEKILFGPLGTTLDLGNGDNSDGDLSILDALSAGGGGVSALLRHSAAAYLNASVGKDFPGIPEDNYLLYQFDDVLNVTKFALERGRAAEIESLKNFYQYFNETQGIEQVAGNVGDGFLVDLMTYVVAQRNLTDPGWVVGDGGDAGGSPLDGAKEFWWDDFLALSWSRQLSAIQALTDPI